MNDKSIEAYNKIIKIIDSCQTVDHINCAWLMIKQFKTLFADPSSKDVLEYTLGLEQFMGLRLYTLHKMITILKICALEQ